MDLRSLRRAVAVLAAVGLLTILTGCSYKLPSPFTGNNTTLTISPQVTSIPVNTTVTFTSDAISAPNLPFWVLGADGAASVGSPTTFNGPSYVYTAPATPPIYSDPGETIQGTVTLYASVPTGKALFDSDGASETFVITAPSVTAGIAPATANVALNATLQLNAYAVGNINNPVTLQVNGVTGGTISTGTIVHTALQATQYYLYTAPVNMPMSGNTVTVTVISQADPTKTASAVITLH